jgi:(heptosyl)LPS beta-1,4-glucosyltransferase
MKLSVAFATYNEEENIGRCLEAVKDLADEIVIVDGSSTDKTVEIASSIGRSTSGREKPIVKVIVTDNPPIFHINKQKAIDACQGDWILQLDADEEVTKALALEIKRVLNLSVKKMAKRQIDSRKERLLLRHQRLVEERDGKVGQEKGEVAAFWVPRKNYFLGRCLIYGGSYPDGVIRLVKKDKARFPCKTVHEQIEIKGRTAWLENDLIHYDSPTFNRYLARADRYTSLTAEELLKEGVKIDFGNHFYYIY